MKKLTWILLVVLVISLISCSSYQQSQSSVNTSVSITPEPTKNVFLPTITKVPTLIPVSDGINLPPKGYWYHGVFPGGTSGEEDDITINDLRSYEQTVGKSVAWVYFSNNWYRDRSFPSETAKWIRDAGSIPYIRLMLRPEMKYKGGETIYSLQNIIDGNFDDDLHAWCMGARQFATNIIVEYGTEVNSDSFVWSGIYNGREQTDGYGDPAVPDGPERFRDAYRHIIQICRDEGAVNITWVFHLDSESHPDEDWNKMEYYYPGDEWIDWIGVSIYGTYSPTDVYYDIFQTRMDTVYPQIKAFAPDKPLIISEFGTAKDNPIVDQVKWTEDAFTTITSGNYPNLIGFSWWNEAWQNAGNSENDTSMRVQDNPELADVFQKFVANNPKVLGEVIP